MSGTGPAVRVGGPHVYPLRPDSDIGGEVYERQLAERLPALGLELVLGLPRDHQVSGAMASAVHIDVLGHRTGIHWLRAPAVFVPYVTSLLRENRVDVLRGHSVRHTGPSLLAGRALARSPVPVVLHHHHFFPRWRRLEAAILRRADAVITVSEHSRAELEAAGVERARVHVVPNGVAGPPPTSPRPELWPGSGLRLLYLGRLEPRKRPGLALQTLAELRRAGVECSLIVAGDGPQRAELEARSAREPVRFAGRVPEQAKWELYDSADVLLFASTLEGFGLVVAEAQSRGLPVVAARGTATAETLEEGSTGLLADPTPAAFAQAVGELADPARRERMGTAARAFARRFDWDATARGVAEALREAAGPGTRHC